MKRLLLWLLCISLLVPMISCGDQKQPAQPDVVTPEPSTIVVPEEKPKEENDKVGVSFSRVHPAIFEHDAPKIMAKWLRSEEDTAIVREEMETMLSNSLASELSHLNSEQIWNERHYVKALLNKFANAISVFGKCDEEFFKTHTVILVTLPTNAESVTAKHTMENGVDKIKINVKYLGGSDAEIHAAHLFILDEVIESQDQIVLDGNELVWLPMEEQAE